MESKQQERLAKQIERLQAEIDSFLQKYDPNNPEHILLLFAYWRIIDRFKDSTKQLFKNNLEYIEILVTFLTSERLVWCATLFDFDFYFNRFLDKYEKWEKYEITLMELIDSTVYLLVILDGFAELSFYVGDEVIPMADYAEQDGKRYKLFDYFVGPPTLNEFDRRYDFDCRYVFDELFDELEDVV